MLPPVFQTIRSPDVIAIVGARVYRHGSAPQDVAKPYVTWFLVSGDPAEQISGKPCADFDEVQIDCWHQTDAGIEALALAVRDALDEAGISNRVVINQRETDTKLYRIAFQASFISSR